MTKREQNVEAGRKFGAAVNAGGIVERFLGFVLVFGLIIFFSFLFLIAADSFLDKFLGNGMLRTGVVVGLFFALPLFVFVSWERNIRKFRHKHGLSIYKNVREELEQMEINERVAKEHKAFVANGIARADGEKKDIDYWFGLLQKGAITQDEYNVKKSELIAG